MKKAVTVITTASVLLFFLAILYLTFGIFLDRKNGPENATARYETLLLSARQTASKYKYGTTEFADNFIQAIGDINDFAKIDFELNETLIYSYPPKNYSLPSSEFSKNFSEVCMLQNGSKIKLSASIYTMRPASIYNHARVSFIIILVGTMTTILLLIYTGVTEAKQPVDETLFYDDIQAEPAKTEEKHQAPVIVEINKQEAEDESPTDDETVNEEATDPEADENPDEEAEAPVQRAQQMELTNEELTAIKEIISTEKEYAEVAEEGDFVDPSAVSETPASSSDSESNTPETTSVFEESLLDEHLTTELENDGDTSLVIVKIANLEEGTPLYANIANVLNEQFKESGIVHAYKADGFAVIVKNANLNSSTAIAEPLHAHISELVSESGFEARVTVGISSKAERKIEAARLIKEADQAEAHAKEDLNSPIVAFRVNPEKYRQMILSKQAEKSGEA